MGGRPIVEGTLAALVSSIAIGIGIDYAIHFIERYKEYAASTGDEGDFGQYDDNDMLTIKVEYTFEG